MRKKSTFFLLSACLLFSISSFAQNHALKFDGNFYAQGNADVIPSEDPAEFTVEFWAFVPGLDGAPHTFLSQGPGGATDPSEFALGYNADGTFNFGAWSSSVHVPLNQWFHFAFTRDNSSDFLTRLYINGVEVENNGSAVSLLANVFQLGVHSDGSQPFIGMMDEFRIWSVVRSAADIKANMIGPVDVNNINLAVYYQMEGTDDDIVNTATARPGEWDSRMSSLDGNPIDFSTVWPASPVLFNTNGLIFNGTNQVVIKALSKYDFATGTVEFFVKPKSSALNSNFSTVLGNRGSDGVRYSFHLSVDAIGVDVGSGVQSIPVPSANTLADDEWHHVAFSNDGTTGTKVYIDGTLIGSIPGSFGAPTTSYPIILGAASSPGAGETTFTGGIDEVRLWDQARDITQIQGSMNTSLTGTEAHLVGQFTFDMGIPDGDNTGLVTALDNTANNNHGTLSPDFALTGTTSNFTLHSLSGSTPLPLALTQFTAIQRGEGAFLQWQTAQEQNTSNFAIERSPDGQAFMTIGSVAAAGVSHSVLNYSFSDATPLKGANFYRLKESDLDGHFTYSPVRLLNFGANGKLIWYMTGPHTAAIYLQQGASELYTITDANGRTLREGQLSNGKTELTQTPPGFYIVRVITADGEVRTTKIVLP